MATPCIAQATFDLQETRRPVVARFDTSHASTDGGAVLLKAVDDRLGLTSLLASCVPERRQAGKIQHSIVDLTRQRVFGIACGYPDQADAARLSDDPVHKLALDRDPVSGRSLATQPTLSRFENAVDRRSLVRMGWALAETVIEGQRRRRRGRPPRRITVDLDLTHDPTHGQQELTFFHGFYDTYCYLTLLGTITFDDEPEQWSVGGMLLPGDAKPTPAALAVVRRLVRRLRQAFPSARVCVRLDGGFAGAQLLDLLDDLGVEYVVGLATNPVLQEASAELLEEAWRRWQRSGKTERCYGETAYEARSWGTERRVVIRAEVTCQPGRDPKANPRFVVTNVRSSPRHVYERLYCPRGDSENRIKELKRDLEIDRTSCSRFVANQLRVHLVIAAYVLMQELRWAARETSCARAQVHVLRDRLLKLAVWVERSVRRIVLHLPRTAPWRDDWLGVARQLGAAVT